MKLLNFILLLILSLAIAGCGHVEELPRERMDPETVATVTYASAPLIFYDDNSAYAAHSRNFVYLGPVRVNNMGNYRYYLWLGIWSTIPSTPPAPQRDGFESITLFIDGELLQLNLAGWDASAIGASESVYAKPVASAADAYYEVTIDQIRLLAESRDARVLTSGSMSSSYELWDQKQAGFQSLARFLDEAAY